MIYFLKTSPFCNNNCVYCEQLAKRNSRHRTLGEIEKELKKVKKSGFNQIRLSCNTDTRKDFLEILQLVKKYNFRIILETNGRMFSHPDFIKKVDEYVDGYEIYLSYSSPFLCRDICRATGSYGESARGIKNMLEFSGRRKLVIAKIVAVVGNLPFLNSVIDKAKHLGFFGIKFILPFKLEPDDDMPFLAEAVPNITLAIKRARKRGLKILLDDKDLEYNSYLPDDLDFFDIGKAKLEIDFKKYKEKPKFSVIIPSYNREKTLPLVINNFLKQDYPKSKYEIIVIDDGSTDNTLAALKKIKLTCNFRYFYWPRKKITPKGSLKKIAKFYNRVGPTRNIGINHAQGEIILFNDADILVTPNCLQKHEKYHNKYPNIIVRGFRMFLPEEFTPSFKRTGNFISLEKISYPERIKRWQKKICRMYYLSHSRELWGRHRVVTANLSVRKKYLEQAGGFSRDFVFWGAEDVDLGFRLGRLRMKLIWDKNIKVYHLYHPLESGDKLTTLFNLWVGKNILYRKYLDPRIYAILVQIIMFYLDESALGLSPQFKKTMNPVRDPKCENSIGNKL